MTPHSIAHGLPLLEFLRIAYNGHKDMAISSSESVFKAGGTLPADHPTYIERGADIELRKALLAGEFCYVLDSRQVGKSSLMVRTGEYLRQEGARVAQLDLQQVGQTSPTIEQWYNSHIRKIGEHLGLRKEAIQYIKNNSDISPVERLFEAITTIFLNDSTSPLIIFIDEIDLVRNLHFDTDEFFIAIREIYTRRSINPNLNRLTFCLLGSATPDALIKSVKATPFNIGCRFTLTDFTPREAAPFAMWLGTNGSDLLERVLYWTSGHPFLTQRICEALRSHNTDPLNAATVDATVEHLFFGKSPKESAHLQQIAKRLLEDDETGFDLTSRLHAHRKIRKQKRPVMREEAANPLYALLRLTGLSCVLKFE